MDDVNELHNDYSDVYKENYNSENLNERDDKFFDPNQFKILGKKKQKSKSTEENTERESTEYLIEKECCKNQIWMEVTTPKISKREAKKIV